MTEQKIKILCVEDEVDIRANIAEILRDEGFEVLEAANGYEGYEVFLDHRPDLIISDIMMPELDGYGLLKLVRETTAIKNSSVPFIFLSALGQKDNVLKGINLSANDYLVKPIDFDMLIAKVKEKTQNFVRVENAHRGQIENLKNQIAVILPKEVFAYLDVISKTAGSLKNEPYGPLPHRQYLEDIKKIYLNSLSLRALISNSLDQEIIDSKLNAEEEITSIKDFLGDFLQNIDENIGQKVVLNNIENIQHLPAIKIDRLRFYEALWLVLLEIMKNDDSSKVVISAIFDHLKQIVLVFYLDSKNQVKIQIDEDKVKKILEKQNCRFEVLNNKNSTAIITIPEYKVV